MEDRVPTPDSIEGLVDRPAYKRAVEVGGIVGFGVSFLVGTAHVGPALSGQVLTGLIAVVVALVVADVLSGLVHWGADTWGASDWPVLGTLLLRPFRAHHVDPASITRHDFWETNGHNGLVTLPLPLLVLALPFDRPWAASFGVFVLALSVALFLTNQVHKLAHTPAPGRLARGLQRRGWILRPEEHARHHEAPYLCAYCITLGWMNRFLDAVRFFGRLEGLITAVTGAEPRAEDARLAQRGGAQRSSG